MLGDLTYGYDQAGRRTKAGGSLARVSLPQAVDDAQYNAANQLTHWAGRDLTYDLNGNLANDGVNQYGWNEQGLLSQMSGGVTALFSYDALGRRRDRTVNGHRMQTVWIGEELNFSIPDGDWSQRIRVFSPYPEIGVDELTYRRIGDDASDDRYVLRDGNNNVIALTDAGQRIRTQYSYEPYGQTKLSGDDDVNVQQYTARENDGTGLYYYRNRYYSPGIGRFTSEDPLGWASGQTNAYAYVGGNPVDRIDPLGLQRGPALLGLGDVYRGDVMPPRPQPSRNGAVGDALGEVSNFPWPSDRLPGDWVGVNVPWTMPDTYCAAGYDGDPVSPDLRGQFKNPCEGLLTFSANC